MNKPFPRYGQMVKGYKYKGPITFDERYGHLTSGQLPADCIEDCSASGQVDEAVIYWVKALGLEAPIEARRDLAVRYLKEYGAWDDLTTATAETMAQRILWTACCDIKEQGEWFGLAR